MNAFLSILAAVGAIGAIVAGAMYLGGLDNRMQNVETDLGSLQIRVGNYEHDELSRLRFSFVVLNEDERSGGSLPPCRDGWQNQADFRISHRGGTSGRGARVRLCTRIEPPEPAN